MKIEIQQKEDNGQGMFYIEHNGEIAGELTYSIEDDGVMTLNHTEVKPELEGKGAASELVKHSVEYARKKNIKIDPLCPYAAHQFKKHEEYRDV
ncbi:MAG TPA: GNAT family N-acetyltransferase, partial [Salinimicrobium sp.]|nr:GNAT family N-acetyltransferase [Salinimicrobium sp.]